MPKKILIVTECFYPEEFKINDVALSWKNKGYSVDVLTMVPTYPESQIFDGYKNKLYQKECWKGLNIYRVHATIGYRDSFFKKMLKYINFMTLGSFISFFFGKKYDYIFGFNAGALSSMLPVVIIRKIYGKPATLWVQDIWPDSVYAYGFKKTKILSFLLDSFVRFIYGNVSGIAISGKGFESKLRPYVDNNMVFNYAPNWADDMRADLGLISLGHEKSVQFTFAGNVGKVQNLENVIMAFSSLSKECLNKAQLNIIGEGPALKKLKTLSNNINIVFHGRKPRKEMLKYYRASDFLIVSLADDPVFNVTVPAKTQTYISVKKPILAIINGDTADIVKENNLGFVANPSNIESIRSTFVKAINTDKDTLAEFTKSCDNLCQEVFNKDIVISRLLKLTVRDDA